MASYSHQYKIGFQWNRTTSSESQNLSRRMEFVSAAVEQTPIEEGYAGIRTLQCGRSDHRTVAGGDARRREDALEQMKR